MTDYSFGDDAAAARRLGVVAEVFAPTTDAVLSDAAALLGQGAATVLDLGCGPGHSTAQLARHLPDAKVMGIDQSPSFVAAARAGAAASCSFGVGDVTRPLPAPADLICARFLLSHLPDVADRICGWCDALAPGGVLVLEEPEHISSEDPDFAAYEAATSGRVADRGADMYAGPLIAAALGPAAASRPINRVVPIEVPAGRAAAMFAANLDSWGHERPDLAELHQRLRRRTDEATTGLFDWRLRQAVIQKSQGDRWWGRGP